MAMFYTVVCWVLAAAGLVLTAWASFWDRSRGRRRCPKCWYDMSGVPGLTCPECGRAQGGESRFFRTRRKYRWVLLGLGLMAAARVVGATLEIRARGWWVVAPRVVLIAALPWLDDAGSTTLANRKNRLFDEIEARFKPLSYDAARFFFWERWILRPVCRSVLAGSMSEESKNLAATLYVTVNDVNVDKEPEERRARLILARCAKVYATCKSFRGTGTTSPPDRRFLIVFERKSGRFRFEYEESDPPKSHMVIWQNENGLHRWWSISSSRGTYADLEHEFGAAYGVSGRASGTVPALLLGLRLVRIDDTLTPRITDIRDIDGRSCWEISGKWWNGGPRVLCIDRATSLLVTSEGSERHRPELNATVTDEDFQFNPPPESDELSEQSERQRLSSPR